jgi:hypothetical protein
MAQKDRHKKSKRKRLTAIEAQLARLEPLSDDDLRFVVRDPERRKQLLPAAVLAACNVDQVIALVGYKPVMRAITVLLKLWLRRLRIERTTARKIKSRTPPLPVSTEPPPLALEEDPAAIPVATDAQPRNEVLR